jgi:hypothetical protein
MAGETVKRGPLLALLVMLMILLHTSDCGATSSTMKDNASSPYHGLMDEPGLMFDSEIIRMLIDFKHLTDKTPDATKPVVSDCNRPPKYASCLPQENKKPPPDPCDTYKRNCKS